jgi:hypothetical protein
VIVEKFVPKSQFELEAVEFTGGIDNGRDVMVWVIGHGGTAEWREEDPGTWNRAGMREHIRIIKGSATMFAYVGDYIFKDGHHGFRPLRKAVVNSEYDKVVHQEGVLA